jgi:hypothetical protein
MITSEAGSFSRTGDFGKALRRSSKESRMLAEVTGFLSSGAEAMMLIDVVCGDKSDMAAASGGCIRMKRTRTGKKPYCFMLSFKFFMV